MTVAGRAPARLLALAGLLAPILSILTLLVLGRFYPGYSHARMQISMLGAQGAPQALLFNLFGLGLPGVMTIACAAGLQRGIAGAEDWFGPAAVALGGLGLAAAAVFHCDPGCVGGTRSSDIHQLAASGIGFLSIAPVLMAPRLKQDPRWRAYAPFSLAAGLVALLCGVAWAFSGELGLGQWEGALQRGLGGAGLAWLAAMAAHLLRTARNDSR
jgi:hypothetical membrane protein